MALTMNLEERKAKAKDLIGFLAAFDVPHMDAVDILSQGYQSASFMDENDYKALGRNLGAFVQLMQGQKS